MKEKNSVIARIAFLLALATILTSVSSCGFHLVKFESQRAFIMKTGKIVSVRSVPTDKEIGDTIIIFHTSDQSDTTYVWIEDDFAPTYEQEGIKNQSGECRYRAVILNPDFQSIVPTNTFTVDAFASSYNPNTNSFEVSFDINGRNTTAKAEIFVKQGEDYRITSYKIFDSLLVVTQYADIYRFISFKER
jgi:hypothetical protein